MRGLTDTESVCTQLPAHIPSRHTAPDGAAIAAAFPDSAELPSDSEAQSHFYGDSSCFQG